MSSLGIVNGPAIYNIINTQVSNVQRIIVQSSGSPSELIVGDIATATLVSEAAGADDKVTVASGTFTQTQPANLFRAGVEKVQDTAGLHFAETGGVVISDTDAAADGVTVPAWNTGPNGIPGHAPPLPSQSTANDDDTLALEVAGALHGSSIDCVVAVAQVCGLASGARGPPCRCSRSSLNGSCGFSLKVAVSRPVAGSAATVPASLRITPEEPCASR